MSRYFKAYYFAGEERLGDEMGGCDEEFLCSTGKNNAAADRISIFNVDHRGDRFTRDQTGGDVWIPHRQYSRTWIEDAYDVVGHWTPWKKDKKEKIQAVKVR